MHIDKSLQEQTQLLSHISHDLRNILTLVDSSLQLIEGNHPEVINFKFWPETKNDIKYMKKYLIALSNYNKSHSISLTTFDIRKMLNELHQELLYTYSEKKMSFNLELDKGIQYIVGDPIMLNIAFINIITNSLEACQAKDTSGEIRITLEKLDSGILLTISDNGQGIPSEFINDALMPFSTSKKGHIGLGLSICDRIIHAHYGKLEIESRDFLSTHVIISLPFIKASTL